ncbi:hypothetical protein DEO72_LG7g1401 [Vigna unguiculata]|uniref:Uncharacterized protein n=1 Tax=Vigna unguiculata TaxID=3917 RepID=A0A4D6MK68_VIGUN|nr:hypothetical protein DEO72_LG7g1401 [Vigna unguiculata]
MGSHCTSPLLEEMTTTNLHSTVKLATVNGEASCAKQLQCSRSTTVQSSSSCTNSRRRSPFASTPNRSSSHVAGEEEGITILASVRASNSPSTRGQRRCGFRASMR